MSSLKNSVVLPSLDTINPTSNQMYNFVTSPIIQPTFLNAEDHSNGKMIDTYVMGTRTTLLSSIPWELRENPRSFSQFHTELQRTKLANDSLNFSLVTKLLIPCQLLAILSQLEHFDVILEGLPDEYDVVVTVKAKTSYVNIR